MAFSLINELVKKFMGGDNQTDAYGGQYSLMEDPSTQGFGNYGMWNDFYTSDPNFSVGGGWGQQGNTPSLLGGGTQQQNPYSLIGGQGGLLDMLSGGQAKKGNPFLDFMKMIRKLKNPNWMSGGW